MCEPVRGAVRDAAHNVANHVARDAVRDVANDALQRLLSTLCARFFCQSLVQIRRSLAGKKAGCLSYGSVPRTLLLRADVFCNWVFLLHFTVAICELDMMERTLRTLLLH